ncbi:MAG: hypothetical protein ABIH71_06930 [Candidatus Omnitrophota bacterium]|nr:hypothetical protein [Candidatus Omnitrophota bacterium]
MVKKSKKNSPEYDSGRETRVLLEQIRNEVKTVAEQHGSIKTDIKEFKSSVERRFDRVEAALMENSRDIRVNSVSIKKVEAAVVENSRDIKELKLEVKEVRIGQQAIEQKLDVSVDNHEQRITRLEEKVGA